MWNRSDTDRDGPALTPTEQQVVSLIADGLTNPQVAERLVVSRSTVTTHLNTSSPARRSNSRWPHRPHRPSGRYLSGVAMPFVWRQTSSEIGGTIHRFNVLGMPVAAGPRQVPGDERHWGARRS